MLSQIEKLINRRVEKLFIDDKNFTCFIFGVH